MHALELRRHNLALEAINADGSVFLLADLELLRTLARVFVHVAKVEEVVQLFAIEFEELDFYLELTTFVCALALIELRKNEIKNSRHNAHLFRSHAHDAPGAHGMRLARASLSIGENCRVVAFKAAQN